MKSKTSFFNWTLMRKNTLRFSPIWIAYVVVWALMLPIYLAMQLSQEGMYRPEHLDVLEYIGEMLVGTGPVVACGYGLVIAMAMFSYLYQARSVSMMHALPIRRSGLFATNYCTGLAFILIPNAAIAALTGIVTLLGGVFCPGMILGWFLMMSAMELFFFSMASFIAMFTGHLAALPVFYGIFNFLAAGLYMAIMWFVEPYLFGMNSFEIPIVSDIVTYLTPLIALYSDVSCNHVFDASGKMTACELQGGGTVAAYAIAGVVLAFLAYAVYLRRRSESAGDVVSVGWAKILFRYGVGICSAFAIGQGLYYGVFGGDFFGTPGKLLCMIFVGAVGFYVAQILLNKSFRVLKRSLPGVGICTAMVLVVFVGAYFDVVGYTRYVPDEDQVDSAAVWISGYDYSDAVVSDEETVARVLQIHQMIVDNRWELQKADWPASTVSTMDDFLACDWSVTYYMKNGSTVTRDYMIPVYRTDLGNEETLGGLVQSLVDMDEYRTAAALHELYTNPEDHTLTGGSFSSYIEMDREYYEQNASFSSKTAQLLYDALMEDAAAGRMPKISMLKGEEEQVFYSNDLCIEWREAGQEYERAFFVELSPCMTATLAALEELGIVSESMPLLTQQEYRDQMRAWEMEEEQEKLVIPESVDIDQIIE